jgi:hypothetical protein
VQRRIQVLDAAAHADGALLGVDVRLVCGQQPLSEAYAHVAAQARVPVALHLPRVALDVDRRIVRVGLGELFEARVLRGRVGAQRVRSPGRRQRTGQRRCGRAQNEQPSTFGRCSVGRLHPRDYNYSPRAETEVSEATLARPRP